MECVCVCEREGLCECVFACVFACVCMIEKEIGRASCRERV